MNYKLVKFAHYVTINSMKVVGLMVRSCVILLILCSVALGQYSWPENQLYKQNTIEKGSGILRSNLIGTFKQISDDRYFLKKSGKGDYGKFKDTTWTLESETELNKNILSPIYTIFTISDKNGHMISTCKNEYDYNKEVIWITETNAKNETREESTLPLRTPTTDYASLIYFLRPFINDLVAGETIGFNFLSCEPGLYKLKAHFINKEELLIGSQKIEAIKIAIRPDMGAFNLILDRFVPPTLLWYSKKQPYAWLKYEGLESGRGSAHIITTVEKEY